MTIGSANKINLKPRLLSLLIIFVAAAAGYLVLYSAFGFAEPSASPPAQNRSTPLNQSLVSQTKSGNLEVQQKVIINGRLCFLPSACISNWGEVF